MQWYKMQTKRELCHRLFGGASFCLSFATARYFAVVSHQERLADLQEEALLLRDLLIGLPVSLMLGLVTAWAISNVFRNAASKGIAQICIIVLYGITVYCFTYRVFA